MSQPKRRRLIPSKSKATLRVDFPQVCSQDINTFERATDKLEQQLDGASIRSRRSSVSSMLSVRPATLHETNPSPIPSETKTLRRKPSWLKTDDVPEQPDAQEMDIPPSPLVTSVDSRAVVAPTQTWLTFLTGYSGPTAEPEQMQIDDLQPAPPEPAGGSVPTEAIPSLPLLPVTASNQSSWYWPFRAASADQAQAQEPPGPHQTPDAPFTSPSAHPSLGDVHSVSRQPSRGWLSSYWWPSAADSNENQGLSTAQATQAIQIAAALPSAVSSTASSDTSNPLVDTMPQSKSTWTSFFASKSTALPPKRIDKGSDEPETMEVDFSEVPATPVTSQPIPRVSSQSSFFGLGRSPSKANSVKDVPVSPQLQPQKDPEPPKSSTSAPLTTSASISRKAKTLNNKSSKQSLVPPPNFVLPSFSDSFHCLPRSQLPFSRRQSTLNKMGNYLFSTPIVPQAGEVPLDEHLPRAREILGLKQERTWRRIKRIVIIGVHGWFPGTAMRTLFGEPTGTSVKFANMQLAAVRKYIQDHGLNVEDHDITSIPLEGEGRVEERVEKLLARLEANAIWLEALAHADAVLIATHSQGCVVSTQLLDRLLQQGRCDGSKCLMLCLAAVAQGPFAHLNSSYLLQPYFNYIENAGARELFEYQNPDSIQSVRYRESLASILNRNVRVLFCGSLNDQVVPLYSSTYTSFTHPNILRAVFVDGQSFKALDFLSNLVAFALRLRNASLDDHGLLIQLSDSLQGALSGLGHSSIYNELDIYTLAIRYLLETEIPNKRPVSLPIEDGFQRHNPREPANPYILPWALRGILEDPQIRKLYSQELSELREQFEHWHPVSKPLKDVKFRLGAFASVRRAKPHPLSTSSTPPAQASKL